MTGQHQLYDFVRANRDPSQLPGGRFERTDGRKVRCTCCGRTGYGLTSDPADLYTWEGNSIPWQRAYSPWQIGCLMPHDWPCSCGRTYPSFANLWRHVGADRPRGWGRGGDHHPVLVCTWPRDTQPERTSP